ncbi:MAG: protein hupE, partial [Mesorhizobium sp.]
MISASTKRTALATILFLAAAMPAYAHVGVGTTSSFTTGFMHPLSGLDHMTVMIAVGLWAAMKGGKAVWAWPLAFVGVMVAGAALGMLQ